MNFRRQPKIKHLLFTKTGCPWKKNVVVYFPQSVEKDFQAITFPQSGYKVTLVETAEGYDLVLVGKDGECRLTSFDQYENAELALLELHKKLTDKGAIKFVSFFVKAIALILAILVAGEIFMVGGSLLFEDKNASETSLAQDLTPQLIQPAMPSGPTVGYFPPPDAESNQEPQLTPPTGGVTQNNQSNQFELSDLNNAFAKGKGTNTSE